MSERRNHAIPVKSEAIAIESSPESVRRAKFRGSRNIVSCGGEVKGGGIILAGAGAARSWQAAEPRYV